MRADYFGHLMDSSLWPIPDEQILKVAPPRGAALHEIIERPANEVGIRLESLLVQRLLADAANEPGVLPLIQSTMRLLWRKISNSQISLSAYDELASDGHVGLLIAMAKIADATHSELTRDQQITARRIFIRLVQFGQGRRDVRRQQLVDELKAEGEELAQFEHTLNHLIEARLLTSSGETGIPNRRIDIAHEALITNWPTLQSWLLKYQKGELYRRQLVSRANAWIQSGRRSGLLHESELEEVEIWLSGNEASILGVDRNLQEWVAATKQALAETRAHAQRQRQMAIQQISELLNETTDLDEALAQSLQIVAETVGVNRGSIILRDEKTQTLICRAMLTDGGSVQRIRIPINFAQGGGLARWVMDYQLPVSIPDVSEDTRWVYEEGRVEDVRSAIVVPLRAKEGKLGVLMITSPTIARFREDHLQLITAIANTISTVIRLHGMSTFLIEQQHAEETNRASRDYISSVSHELRTPLTSIKGYVDLLLLGAAGPLGEGPIAFLNVVKNNANRLMDLINDILEIGRIDADKIKLLSA
jgi:putative methionine-R-sulfoxide reductase with GAF domain